MEADAAIEGKAFVRYEEVRPQQLHPCHTHRLEPSAAALLLQTKVTQGSRKVLKFFLYDSEGNKHLAACGDDLGDAHYQYHSVKPFNRFGPLSCHTRKELLMW